MKQSKHILTIISLLLSVSCVAQEVEADLSGEEPLSYDSYQLAYVIDGDTFAVNTGKEVLRIRLIGVDAPENTTKEEPLGPEATAFTNSMLGGKVVYLLYGEEREDVYGRTLAHVAADAEDGDWDTLAGKPLANVNLELVRAGLATAERYPPNTRYARLYEQAEREAKEAGRGLWRDYEKGMVEQMLDRLLGR